MKTIYYAVAAIAWLSLWGCTNLVQEVNPDKLPSATAKLVVHSFISPQDTVLAVYVQAPKAVLGSIVTDPNDFVMRSIPNATVDLSDGTQTVRLAAVALMLNQISVTQYYGIDARKLPIVAGHTYTLSVSAPGYSRVTSQCTVPAQVKPGEIQVDSIQSDLAQQMGLAYVARLVWQDPAGQSNYYSVRGSNYKKVQHKIYTYPPTTTRDTIITYDGYGLDFKGALLVSDQDKDGQQFVSTKGEGSNVGYDSRRGNKLLSYTITMTLANVDENYYRYRTAIDQQEKAGENPFAEPVLIPSNIKNGLGCFGALNQASLSVKVR